ncbi:MAG: hypothetical protein AB1384_07820 [Actinomycetota bacterium]
MMRKTLRKTTVMLCVLLFLPGLLMVAGTQAALAPPVPFYWTSTGGGAGFSTVGQFAYDPVHDVLYAATWGTGVWRCEAPRAASPTWVDMGIDASASISFQVAYDSAHDLLYVGTLSGLWRCSNPSSASPSWTQPQGITYGAQVDTMAYDPVHDALYIGFFDSASVTYEGAWRCDNPRAATLAWTDISAASPVGGYRIDSLAYDASTNLLYAGCSLVSIVPPTADGKGVWRCSGPDSASPAWTDTGTGTIDTYIVTHLALDPLGDHLYASPEFNGVWRCDNASGTPSWSDMGGGFGGSAIEDLAYDPNNNALYVCMFIGNGVTQCLAPDTAPVWQPTGGAIATFAVNALAIDPFNFVLYADCFDIGTYTEQDVYRAWVDPASHWYFAEGYTGADFQEYLCLGNPGTAPITARVTYLFPDGTSQSSYYSVPASSRTTVDVNDEVGPNREVSMFISSSDPGLIAERPMYFSYGPGWTGGHDAVGAEWASSAWYFAEGYTGPGFDEWLCVLNPGGEPAHLRFRFQTQTAGEIIPAFQTVPPYSRASFSANSLLGGVTYETSLLLESDLPVVAERPMYFDYLGGNPAAPKHWTGGHCVMGATGLGTDYYFAEGYTGPGFDEYITIQNPFGAPITVDAEYQLGPGQGGPVNKSYTVPANARRTVYVNGPEGVGNNMNVSVHLTSADVFLAERPMYFNYRSMWTGGHCVIGSRFLRTDWFFAEGYTGSGFDEYLCIQNPNPTAANVTITYYPEGGGTPIIRPHPPIAANSRYTVGVNSDARANLSLSAKVVSDQPVVVERPMYFDFFGWTGGHDVVGYAP